MFLAMYIIEICFPSISQGCTFLGIFGLPGFKNEKDCMHALLCAYRMKQQLDEIPKLACVYIYCLDYVLIFSI